MRICERWLTQDFMLTLKNTSLNGETTRRQRPAGFVQAFEGHGGVGRSKGEKREVHYGREWHATKGQGAHSKGWGGFFQTLLNKKLPKLT